MRLGTGVVDKRLRVEKKPTVRKTAALLSAGDGGRERDNVLFITVLFFESQLIRKKKTIPTHFNNIIVNHIAVRVHRTFINHIPQ